MRGLVVRNGAVALEHDVAEPTPGAGQVLVRPLLCGICGSDLHAPMIQISDPENWPESFVLGHEYVVEILDHGPGTDKRYPVGTRVGSVPYVDGSVEPELIGFSGEYPGALSDLMVLQEDRLVEFPGTVDPQRAVLTEPLAVGFHAVNQTPVERGDAVLVVGCGPVGLSTIAALRQAGHGPIVAVDFSPKRRQLAEGLGADVVLDPGQDSPYETWVGLAGDPLPPSPLLTIAGRAPSVLFDCVGLPGLMQQHIDAVPPHTQITTVGVCMQPDPIMPVSAIMKELTVRYVFGYTASEYEQAFRAIAGGSVDVGPWVTAVRPLDEALDAFADLGAPDHHCKVVIRPTA
jgi:2-desacetyl-2-hydroxyethyl bacteriochlorophyllide A dehydrogenase